MMLLGGARDVVVSQFRRLAANPRLEMERVMAWLNLPLAVTFRKRTSTALHALASETPTAKSKAHGHTEFGEAGP